MVIAGHDFKPADTPVTRVMAAPVVVAAGMVVVALAPIVTLGRGRVPNRSASLDFGKDADQHAVRPGRDGPGLGRVAVVMGLGKDMPAQSTCIACSVNWGRPADSVDLSRDLYETNFREPCCRKLLLFNNLRKCHRNPCRVEGRHQDMRHILAQFQ